MRRVLAGLHRLEELTLSVTLLVLAVIATVQVVSRYAFGVSFSWFEEGGRYVGVFITFLGASIGVQRGSHFAMDALASVASPLLGRWLKALTAVISGGFLVVVTWYGMKIVLRNYGYETTSPTMQVPMYLVYLPVPAFAAVMAVRFFRAAGQALAGPRAAGAEGAP